MKKLLCATAAVALLAGAPAFAQSTPAAPSTTNQPMSATPPATTSPAVTAPSAAAPVVTASAPKSATDYITTQGQDQLLASKLIGESVYNSADENLGDINDIVFDTKGATIAVVLGVGGFLGIGEKAIAVPYGALQASTDKDGNMKLVLNADKKALEGAPEFKTLDDQRKASSAASSASSSTAVKPSTAPATGSSMGTKTTP